MAKSDHQQSQFSYRFHTWRFETFYVMIRYRIDTIDVWDFLLRYFIYFNLSCLVQISLPRYTPCINNLRFYSHDRRTFFHRLFSGFVYIFNQQSANDSWNSYISIWNSKISTISVLNALRLIPNCSSSPNLGEFNFIFYFIFYTTRVVRMYSNEMQNIN